MADDHIMRIREAAQRDPAFRERLLADPRAALSEALGMDVPEGVRVKVVEEEPGEILLGIPPAVEGDEIVEEELAGVAGGTGWGSTVTCKTFTC